MKNEQFNEESIGRLIAGAYDRAFEPDPTKLRAVEHDLFSALSRRQGKPRRSVWHWWLILGLAAIGAAAWWVGDFIQSGTREAVTHTPVMQSESSQNNVSSESRVTRKPAAPQASHPDERTEERTIYRRERR